MLRFPTPESVDDYRRDLNLDRAVAAVEYTAGGVRYLRETFATQVDNVIVVRLTADQPASRPLTLPSHRERQSSSTRR